MIKLKISPEALIDLFTPGVLTPHKCVKGLPRNVNLVDIGLEDQTIVLCFDDGKEQVTETRVTYEVVL